MHICHIATTHNVLSDSRIMQRMCFSLKKSNFKVSIISSNLNSQIYNGVEIKSISQTKYPKAFFPVEIFKSCHMALKIKADVYHIHEVPHIISGLILKILGKKIVMDFHEDFEAELFDKHYLSKFAASLFLILYKLSKYLLIPFFDHILLAEESYKKVFLNLENKSTVIKNYPVTKNFKFSSSRHKKEIKVVYIGIISEDRGIKNIIQATKKLNEKFKITIKLDLIGRISDKELEKYVTEETVSSNGKIHWKGQYKYSKILDILTSYDIGFAALHNKRNYRNSLPTKILEYNSAGLYCIVSDLPISHKYIIEGFNGSIIQPDQTDELIKCLSKLSLRIESLDRNSIRQHIMNNFQWNTEFEKLENIYKNLI